MSNDALPSLAQIGIGDRDLRIQSSSDNEHRSRRFAEEMLIHEGKLGKNFAQVFLRICAFKD
jgi:hypothetical protein